jgi:16S rRNA (uracil1498-N3)-methyltransferase
MKPAAVLVAPGALVAGARLALDDSEAHHLRVRRAEPDREILLLDGAGTSALATLERRDGALMAHVGALTVTPAPPPTLLAVGAGDRERMIALAERCTELGISRLIPLETERALTVDNRFRDSSVAKAARRAREACKQSGNSWAAAVDSPLPLEALGRHYPGTRWLLGAMDGGACPAIGASEPIGWIIGPEGGLTPGEEERVRDMLAATPVRLSEAVLRFDTAAIAAAAVTHDRRRAAGA